MRMKRARRTKEGGELQLLTKMSLLVCGVVRSGGENTGILLAIVWTR
jgi:hypothetical protein